MKVLELVGISKNFGKKKVLNDISFSVEKNQILGLIGKSGAGKTTILKILIGYYRQDVGYVYFNEQDYSHKMNHIRSQVGFVTQDNCFYDELTVMENLEYFGKMYNMTKKLIHDNAKELLHFLKLTEEKHTVTSNLSGGMRRRVDFACAMIHNPTIIIMDEPTTGLDPLLRKDFWKLIKHIRNIGKTIIFSSHLLSELDSLCDSVAIIKDGEIAAFGKNTSVKSKFTDKHEMHLVTFPGNYEKIVKLMKEEEMPITDYLIENQLKIFTANPHDTLKGLTSILDKLNEKLIDMDIKKPTLDEVFAYYMGQ